MLQEQVSSRIPDLVKTKFKSDSQYNRHVYVLSNYDLIETTVLLKMKKHKNFFKKY